MKRTLVFCRQIEIEGKSNSSPTRYVLMSFVEQAVEVSYAISIGVVKTADQEDGGRSAYYPFYPPALEYRRNARCHTPEAIMSRINATRGDM